MPPLAKPQVNQHHGTYNRTQRSGGTGSIKYICVHYTATNAPAKNNCVYFAGGNRKASADFFIDDEGIWEYNDPEEGYYTWAVGDGNGKYGVTNENSVSIEVVSDGQSPFGATKVGYLTTLVKYLMSKYNVPADHVVRHYDASKKTCPVQYCPPKDANNKDWTKLWQQITAGKGLAPTLSGTGSTTASGTAQVIDHATAYAFAINHKSIFSREETYPYIITIDQNTSKLDFSIMKDSDIVAACVDMGQYYNSNHTVRANFCQPRFDIQCQELVDNKFPFGVYTNIYAKTTKEVELEVKQMRFPLRRFPPKLGLWLVPHFGTNKSLNDTLIEKYQELLEGLGFKGQIGFYCTQEDLKYTSWKDKFCDSWYFWMNRHMKKLDTLEEGMPEPEFFRFDNPKDELMIPDLEAAKNIVLGMSTGSGSSDSFGGSKEDNAKLIWSALVGVCGFSNTQVAGALSNFEAESNLDPTSIETIYNEPYNMGTRKTEAAKDFNAFKAKVQSAYANANLGYSINWSAYMSNGKFCPGIGMVQWTGPGGVALRDCADKVAGGKWWNLDFQVAYMIAKGSPTGAMGGSRFFDKSYSGSYASQNYATGQEAAVDFTKFENGAMPSAQVSSHIKTANSWVSKMGGWTQNSSFNQNVQNLVNSIKAS